MEEEELLQALFRNLNNLHCYNCGKSAKCFVKGADSLLGCLRYDVGDAERGDPDEVFWECPECAKEDARKRDIGIGKFRVMTEERGGKLVTICANCGSELGLFEMHEQITAAETGYFYCSAKCAAEDTRKSMDLQKQFAEFKAKTGANKQ